MNNIEEGKVAQLESANSLLKKRVAELEENISVLSHDNKILDVLGNQSTIMAKLRVIEVLDKMEAVAKENWDGAMLKCISKVKEELNWK